MHRSVHVHIKMLFFFLFSFSFFRVRSSTPFIHKFES